MKIHECSIKKVWLILKIVNISVPQYFESRFSFRFFTQVVRLFFLIESEIFERWSSPRALLCFADLGRRSGEDLAIYKKSGLDSRKLEKRKS